MSSKARNSSPRKSAPELLQARSGAHKKLARAYDWLREHSPELLGGVAVVAGTASGWFGGGEALGWGLLGLTLVLTVASGVLTARRTQHIATLAHETEALERESAREKEALRTLLRHNAVRFLKDSGYWAHGTCRLSVYGHVDDRFFLICRVSNDPSKERPGRAWYPDNQGQIRVAWEKGVVDESGWQKDTARKKAIESGMPESVANQLTMFPRGMVGVRVDSGLGEKTGLILLESDKPHELDEALDRMASSPVFKMLLDAVAATEAVFEPLSQPAVRVGDPEG